MAGNITKRGRDVWLVQVFLGRDPETGKQLRHRKTVHGKKEDAQRYLTGFLRDRDLGRYSEPTKLTVNAYLDRWLATVQGDLAPKTFHDYQGNLARYIRPGLGAQRLDRLTSLQVQEALSAMTARGLSPRTVQYARSIIRQALEQAVEWGLIPDNPAARTRGPKQKAKPPRRVFTLEESERFLEAAREDRLGMVLEFALGTGMRPEEYLGLKWEDVDLVTRLATVRHVLVFAPRIARDKDGQPLLDEAGNPLPSWSLAAPKTKGSVRSIILSESLVVQLRRHKARQNEVRLATPGYQNNGLVFPSSYGTPMQRKNLFVRHFVPVLKAAGIQEEPSAPRHRKLTLYTLRHTHATLLLLAGLNPKVIAERLGHSGIAMTLSTYAHVLPSMQEAAADQYERLVYRAVSAGTQEVHRASRAVVSVEPR